MGIEVIGSAGLVEGFNTIEEITTSNSAYDVSSVGFAKITIIGGGGGGAANTDSTTDGSDSSVTIGGVTTTASGGNRGRKDGTTSGPAYATGSFNGGSGRVTQYTQVGSDGNGGEIRTIYEDLSLISTIDVVIGAGGSGTGGASGYRGTVILEYTS